MAFTEATKLAVKKRAHFTCCWCRDPRNKVEIHHIVQQAIGGVDSEDNAAPLCSNCHTLYGGNTELRKEIVHRRDFWYEQCINQKENWDLAPVLQLIEDKFEELKQRTTVAQIKELTEKHILPTDIQHVIMFSLRIEGKLKTLAISYHGGWAGVHLATGYEIFLNTLEIHKNIDERLTRDIKSYYLLADLFIRGGIPETEFNKLQQLAADIFERISAIPLGPLGGRI